MQVSAYITFILTASSMNNESKASAVFHKYMIIYVMN